MERSALSEPLRTALQQVERVFGREGTAEPLGYCTSCGTCLRPDQQDDILRLGAGHRGESRLGSCALASRSVCCGRLAVLSWFAENIDGGALRSVTVKDSPLWARLGELALADATIQAARKAGRDERVRGELRTEWERVVAFLAGGGRLS